MNNLIRNIVFGTAIAAVVVSGLSGIASLPGEPEVSIARCAAIVAKMPCL
jgi:hypothetical protein